MKKTIMTVALLVSLITTGFSQTFKVDRVKDEMTDKVSSYPSHFLLFTKVDTKAAFRIDPVYKENKSGELELTYLIIKSVSIGSCNENDELIVLFKDGQKITLKSFNDFNCKGTSYFSVSETNREIFSTIPIDKVRFMNGRSYDSLTSEPTKALSTSEGGGSVEKGLENFFVEMNKSK